MKVTIACDGERPLVTLEAENAYEEDQLQLIAGFDNPKFVLVIDTDEDGGR
ncbi:MAG TPA: hypothetical protein VJY15_23295 [Candidatus Acidoferrum sp.]|nr:hypothetical protein [Candidatus Acidoferrum sp.]